MDDDAAQLPEDGLADQPPEVLAAEVLRLRERLQEVQALAQMGWFEWDVAADRVAWSTELWNLHGLEPRDEALTYEEHLAWVHPEDRSTVREAHLHALASGEPYFASERVVRPDGDVRVLDTSALVVVAPDGQGVVLRGVSVDVTSRWRIEDALRHSMARTQQVAAESAQLEMRLHDARLRRKQAVEINDNIIQGLAAAVMAIDVGHHAQAAASLQRTLDAARRMMADLLAPLEGADLDPSDLIREEAAPGAGGGVRSDGEGQVRVLLVDDAEDIRLLVRYALLADGRFRIVGEAADGFEAIRQAEVTQPDVVLLDVAMPRLDGIAALPRIHEVAPSAVVIVLSGFGAEQLARQAVEAGAAAYVEKGAAAQRIVEVVLANLPQPPDT